MFCFVFIASAQPTPAENWLNENGQLPVVDALWDQTEDKCCLSYKINSIFSGSCVQNNNYYISTAAFYSATNWMSHSPVNSQTIVSIPLLIQRKGECLPQEMWPWDVSGVGGKSDTCTPPFVVPKTLKTSKHFNNNVCGFSLPPSLFLSLSLSSAYWFAICIFHFLKFGIFFNSMYF